MMPELALVQLLLLHSPDGREILVNPESVTSMWKSGGQVHGSTHCVVNLLDGKHISVVETCDEIDKRLKELRQQ